MNMSRMMGSLRSMVCAAVILCAFAGAWPGDASLAVNRQEPGVTELTFLGIIIEGASFTSVKEINNHGHTVGDYIDKDGKQHGFLFANGVFTQIDNTVGINTAAIGINDHGQIVGVSISIDGNDEPVQHGFLRDNDGTFTPIDSPESVHTGPISINDLGQIVGHTGLPDDGTLRGFLYNQGAFTPIDYPNALGTAAEGINNFGQITGYFIEAGDRSRGFLRNNGVFTPIDFPGATNTAAYRINNSGEVVGVFGENLETARGFLLSNGVYTPIDFPRATATIPLGINDSGQIVGEFTDSTGVTRGFLANRGCPICSGVENVAVKIIGTSASPTGLDPSAATLTVTGLLDERAGGSELVPGLPLVLTPAGSSNVRSNSTVPAFSRHWSLAGWQTQKRLWKK